MKKALITGITGQDGSYLAELLLSKGYEVHGLIRQSSSNNSWRIDHLIDPAAALPVHLHYGDLAESARLNELLRTISPAEIYNLGAQSHVGVSFDLPEYTANISALGTIRLLDAVVKSGIKTKFYQASTSEVFGNGVESPQNENTRFRPRNPYGSAKAFAFWSTVNYRDAYGMHASNGILYNHESPRRAENYVTRKITSSVAKIMAGTLDGIHLGNIDAARDWGFAKEYVEAMWLMLQQDSPDDFIIATGTLHTIREFLDEAFGYVGLDWHKYVKHDPKLIRPTEVELLVGDPSKAKQKLGWQSQTSFRDLVRIMIEADLAREGVSLKKAG